ncbi:MAG: hypothetical protein ACHREM_13590 [Polyangiales bacterium]
MTKAEIDARYAAANALEGRARGEALDALDAEIRAWNRGVNQRNRAARRKAAEGKPQLTIKHLPHGTRLFHGSRAPTFVPKEHSMWLTRTVESARDYGPRVHTFVTRWPARLFVFDSYEGALQQLGVQSSKGASRALADALKALPVDGYWYRNPPLSEEIMLLNPEMMLVTG